MIVNRQVTAMAAAFAHADFRRARRGHWTARLRRRLRRTRPSDLAQARSLRWQPARRSAIPLAAIVGTVEVTADFDAGFRPANERVARRWQSIARAHHDGHPLPPIDVIELTDGYYVLDGRHRVSVARALGHAQIEAWTRRGFLDVRLTLTSASRASIQSPRWVTRDHAYERAGLAACRRGIAPAFGAHSARSAGRDACHDVGHDRAGESIGERGVAMQHPVVEGAV